MYELSYALWLIPALSSTWDALVIIHHSEPFATLNECIDFAQTLQIHYFQCTRFQGI